MHRLRTICTISIPYARSPCHRFAHYLTSLLLLTSETQQRAVHAAWCQTWHLDLESIVQRPGDLRVSHSPVSPTAVDFQLTSQGLDAAAHWTSQICLLSVDENTAKNFTMQYKPSGMCLTQKTIGLLITILSVKAAFFQTKSLSDSQAMR